MRCVLGFLNGALDGLEEAEVFYYNLNRAFGTIDRVLLVRKKECYGFRGRIVKIRKYYLED